MATPDLRNIMNQSYVDGLKDFESVITRLSFEQQATNDRRYIIDIMSIVFGSDKTRSWLSQCAEDLLRSQDDKSRARFDLFMNLLSTSGPFYKMLQNFKGARCILLFNQLPLYLQAELNELRAARRSSFIASSVQQYCRMFNQGDHFFEADRCNPTILEWFLFMLVTELKKFTWNKRFVPDYESLVLDDYFYDITRNPPLVLIRRYLHGFGTMHDQTNRQKLCFLIKEYFVKDLFRDPIGLPGTQIMRMSGNACFEVIQQLIYFSRQTLQPQQMYKYFENLLRSDKSNFISEGKISDIIRIWLYFIRPCDRIQAQVVHTAITNDQKPKESKIYKVKKYLSEMILDKPTDQYAQNFVKQYPMLFVDMFHLLVKAMGARTDITYKQLYWLDNVVTYFTKSAPVINNITSLLCQPSRVRDAQNYASKLLQSCQITASRPPAVRLSQKEAQEIGLDMKAYTENIQRGLTEIYKIGKGEYVERKPIYSEINLERMYYPLISHTDVRGSPWLAPIAEYESSVAFYFWMSIAKALDFLMIRGLKGYPRTNLRWLCSYTNTIIISVVLFILIFFGLSRSGDSEY